MYKNTKLSKLKNELNAADSFKTDRNNVIKNQAR